MLDIKFVRNNASLVAEVCKKRRVQIDVPALLAADAQRLELQVQLEAMRQQGNKVAAATGAAKADERAALVEEGARIKRELKQLDEQHDRVSASCRTLMMSLPNLLAPDTPEENTEVEVLGERPPVRTESKDHIALGQALGMDFDAGSRVAGSGFPLMRGSLALLEDALLHYTYAHAVERGFMPVNVPLLARNSVLEGLGFNPRRDDVGTEIFSTAHDELCLVGTAEIPLVGQFADQILDSKTLPLRMVALTPCFRREGAYGRRDAGLYRNKMFHKVELVVLASQDQSEALLEEILAFEKSIFQGLGLYFRVLRIAAYDLGAPAFKKYDLEGWMMGRGSDGQEADWGELTSCSNCTDYQSRRLNIRHRSGKEKPELVHTLNGTGVTTRALISILEQYQTNDGAVVVPQVLRPYLGGREVLTPTKA